MQGHVSLARPPPCAHHFTREDSRPAPHQPPFLLSLLMGKLILSPLTCRTLRLNDIKPLKVHTPRAEFPKFPMTLSSRCGDPLMVNL